MLKGFKEWGVWIVCEEEKTDVCEPTVPWKHWYVRPQAETHRTNGFTPNIPFVSSSGNQRSYCTGAEKPGSSLIARRVCPRHPSGLPCYDDRVKHSLARPTLDSLSFCSVIPPLCLCLLAYPNTCQSLTKSYLKVPIDFIAVWRLHFRDEVMLWSDLNIWIWESQLNPRHKGRLTSHDGHG